MSTGLKSVPGILQSEYWLCTYSISENYFLRLSIAVAFKCCVPAVYNDGLEIIFYTDVQCTLPWLYRVSNVCVIIMCVLVECVISISALKHY